MNDLKFSLMKKRTYLLNKTTIKYFYVNRDKKNIEKKYKAINVNGYRKKLNIEDGEIRDYTHREIDNLNRISGIQSARRFKDLIDCNVFKYFVTFTFDPTKFNRSDVVKTTDAMLEYLKKYNRKFKDFSYAVVVETHKSENSYETKEYHFHGLFNNIPINSTGLNLTYSGKVCCSWSDKKIVSADWFEKTKAGRELKDLDGEKVYNINTWLHGFSTCTIISDREKCNSYLKKYLSKEMNVTGLFKRNYFCSRNLLRPFSTDERICCHKDPENLDDYIKDELEENYYDKATFNGYNKTYNVKKYVVENKDLSKEEMIEHILNKTKSKNKNSDFKRLTSFKERNEIFKIFEKGS